ASRTQEEAQVLVEDQQTQVGGHAQPEVGSSAGLVRNGGHAVRAEVIDHRAEGDEQRVLRPPAHVEPVAGDEQQDPAPIGRQEEEEQRDYREEDQEVERVEEHAPPGLFLGGRNYLGSPCIRQGHGRCCARDSKARPGRASTFTDPKDRKMHRAFLIAALLAHFTIAAQPTVVQQGKPFERLLKGSSGDILTVVDGLFAEDGRHLLYMEEGLTPKAVRLDALLQPTEELVLKDVMLDGLKWTGVRTVIRDGRLHVLLVSAGKKGCEFGTAEVGPGLALQGLHRLAAFEIPYANEPVNTMAMRPLPDPILFTRGLAYAQTERLVSSPDGQHHLLNHYTH